MTATEMFCNDNDNKQHFLVCLSHWFVSGGFIIGNRNPFGLNSVDNILQKWPLGLLQESFFFSVMQDMSVCFTLLLLAGDLTGVSVHSKHGGR